MLLGLQMKTYTNTKTMATTTTMAMISHTYQRLGGGVTSTPVILLLGMSLTGL
eukprot:gnl/Chilomastix_caulleri/3823.p1 GENE.gnl/Chilomastix_caulleri/3823~~gnl/Chilomastix_caulleri/3823.p1  ORF type:complete len:53 (-),score=14.58 gnl/Chilomastix_caulleri/3823:60-218(-)